MYPQVDGDGGAAGQCLEGGAETALGQIAGWMPPAVAQVLSAPAASATARASCVPSSPGSGRAAACAARRCRAGDQSLLGAVVRSRSILRLDSSAMATIRAREAASVAWPSALAIAAAKAP